MNVNFKLIALIFFCVSFLLMFKVIFNDGYPDFRNYYFNPIIAFEGRNPYLPDKNLFTPSVYPPFVFLFFIPLSLIPFQIAEKIWILLSISALMCSLYLLFKINSKKVFSSENLILSSLVFLSFPVKFTLGMGQVNMFILLLVSLFLFCLNKSPHKASLFLGLSLLLKIFPIFILIYLLVKKKWKIFISIITTILIGIALTFIFIENNTNVYFYQKVLPTLVDSWKGDYYNQSISGLITRGTENLELGSLLKNISSLILLIISFLPILLIKSKDKYVQNLEIGIVIAANLILNSFSWQHHFVWMIIPLFSTYFFIKEKYHKNITALIILIISYFLISLNLKMPLEFPLLFQSHVFFGALILLFLEIYLLSSYLRKKI